MSAAFQNRTELTVPHFYRKKYFYREGQDTISPQHEGDTSPRLPGCFPGGLR